MSDLLPAERKRLAALEAKVEEGIAAFITTGEALREIRDERYYRVEHKTFEEYLDARWSYSRQQGYRLIDAAEVALLVSPIGDTDGPVRTESQARALTPLKADPDLLAAAVEVAQQSAATEDRPVTAKDYARAVEVVQATPEPAGRTDILASFAETSESAGRALARYEDAGFITDLRRGFIAFHKPAITADQTLAALARLDRSEIEHFIQQCDDLTEFVTRVRTHAAASITTPLRSVS